MAREVNLTKGFVATVDDEDFDKVSRMKWHVQTRKSTNYAVSNTTRNGKRTKIYLHALVTNRGQGVVVDHINYDGLDNRKENLRIVSASINSHNKKNAFNKYGYIGIEYDKKGHRFFGTVIKDKNSYRTKRFIDLIEAVVARDDLAIKIYGENARLNLS